MPSLVSVSLSVCLFVCEDHFPINLRQQARIEDQFQSRYGYGESGSIMMMVYDDDEHDDDQVCG